MPNILNLTLPLKQDAASQATIKDFATKFATVFWPKVKQVLYDSHMVHYARFTVIPKEGTPRWVQVLTEYDTDFETYSNYFADNLTDFFATLFAVVEGAPPAGDASNRAVVFKFIQKYDLPCLGGVYFSAFGDLKVKEMQQKLNLV